MYFLVNKKKRSKLIRRSPSSRIDNRYFVYIFICKTWKYAGGRLLFSIGESFFKKGRGNNPGSSLTFSVFRITGKNFLSIAASWILAGSLSQIPRRNIIHSRVALWKKIVKFSGNNVYMMYIWSRNLACK